MNDRDRFDKFTERARKVLSLAQEEAQRFNHNYIGTEHLLLGLVREGDGVAAKVLSNLGVELNKVRSAVEFIIGRGDRIVLGDIGLTPRAKKVIELAVDEARRLNHHYIGTEHLLLGLVREGEGIAAGVLESLGVNLEKVRTQTIQVLNQSGGGHGETAREKHSKTPTIDQMGIDLTAQARTSKLDPIIGREKEIERVIQILSRRQKNNPALIGEPGVGKTAIVEGLAQRIVSGEVPETLAGKRLLTLDVGSLVAGTKYRGEFEERLKKIIEEIRSSQDCVIFIDEVHTLVGAGAAEGAVDAANILKPALSRGELQCIGATTLDEYRKYIEKDAALQRRFQEVIVRESTVEETVQILKGIRERYEQHHRLIISDDALKAAAEMGSRYITDRFLPDKAIDLIDEAASRVRMQRSLAPLNLKEASRGLEAVLREKDAAIQNQDYQAAAELRDREVKLRERIAKLEAGWHRDQGNEKPTVGEEDIAQIVSMWTGIPVMRIAQEESARLLEMEGALHKRVIGQDEAIDTISRAVRRARAGLKDPKRPIGSFIFMGPTGVGKSELAKALAEFMFGSEDALIKIDMSEFMERHAAARLVGAPPGYVGYEEGGQLTEAVRRKSYSVILLDEIEKAHPDVFNMLLQILEDGKLTDAKGRTVDFRNTIVIMTSNVGASLLNREAAIGFMHSNDKDKQAQAEYDRMRDKVLGELKNTFKPEFLNRIDAIMVFHSLRQEHVRQIVDLMLSRVRVQLTEQQVELLVPDDAKDFLVTKGYDPQYGARPLRRTIQNLVEDPLAEGLLQGKFRPGDIVETVVRDGTVVLEVRERREDMLRELPPPPEAALSAGEAGSGE
ncbi:MAG: ATP-dependent Clp protease, ATP-binding subunit ClpC [Ktedonobacterales bacterium]|nr:MAG: ATP-dependent Clp protease, ATP-binding subunit ClpC [Ktedonobacterales bacterium]